jgi:hypothetical protein
MVIGNPLKNASIMLLIGVAAFATSSGFSKDAKAETYILKAKYHVGEIHDYAIQTAIYGVTGDNRAVGIRFDMRMHVISVSPNRSTIRVAASAPKSGKTELPSPYKPATVVLDQWNRPIGTSTGGQIFTSYPNHPIKVGDQWNGTSNLMLGTNKGATLDTAYKLNSVQTYKGRQIAELTMKLGGLASGEGTELIDLADGSLLSSDMNLKVNQGKKIPVQIVLKRQY